MWTLTVSVHHFITNSQGTTVLPHVKAVICDPDDLCHDHAYNSDKLHMEVKVWASPGMRG